jgi:hypothetical protein
VTGPPKRNGPGAPASAAEAKGDDTECSFSPNFSRKQAAAHAATWGDKLASRRMVLRSFRPLAKGALRGFATVELPIGLVLRYLPIFFTANGPWVGLPRKPLLDTARRQKIDANGQPSFQPVAEWRSRELSDRFSAGVVELVRAAHPEALDERTAAPAY